jgi:hypothetical protein
MTGVTHGRRNRKITQNITLTKLSSPDALNGMLIHSEFKYVEKEVCN